MLRARAEAHYQPRRPRRLPAPIRSVYRVRADRQVRQTLEFVPRYLAAGRPSSLGLWRWPQLGRRGRLEGRWLAAIVLGLTIADLFGFGLGCNPAIAAADDRPEPRLIADLRREVGGAAGSSASARNCRRTP